MHEDYWKRRYRAFCCAFAGGVDWLRHEPHARLHLLAAAIAFTVSLFLQISPLGWVLICFSIALVWVTEILNSALERLADCVQPDRDERIRRVKDLAAFAVLVASANAVIVAVWVWLIF